MNYSFVGSEENRATTTVSYSAQSKNDAPLTWGKETEQMSVSPHESITLTLNDGSFLPHFHM